MPMLKENTRKNFQKFSFIRVKGLRYWDCRSIQNTNEFTMRIQSKHVQQTIRRQSK